MIDSVPRLKTTLAYRLKFARIGARLTQREAASAIGVSRPVMVQIEHGRRAVTVLEMAALAKLYGRTVDSFLDPERTHG